MKRKQLVMEKEEPLLHIQQERYLLHILQVCQTFLYIKKNNNNSFSITEKRALMNFPRTIISIIEQQTQIF